MTEHTCSPAPREVAGLRVFSYGGGVQSTAALVLAAQGRIDFPTFLFANVGDDSEHPATIAYVRDVAAPYAEANGIDVHELRATWKGEPDSLMARLERTTSASVAIPVRLSSKGPPVSRNCTSSYKVEVLAKWCHEHGAAAESPAVVGIGISTDEVHRMTTGGKDTTRVVVYPLIDLRLDRSACAEIIRRAGLPVPRKSACYFCPFHTIGAWRELRRDEPELFAKSVALETTLNDRRDLLGKDHVYFNSRAVPLMDIPEAETPLFDGEGVETCDAFSCFT